jgi:hypothetical protein
VIPSLGGSYEFKSEFEVFTVLSMLLCKLWPSLSFCFH